MEGQIDKITLDRLGKRFGKQWIIRGLIQKLEPGKTYSVVGSNGSGKSTLMRLLAGWSKADEGQVLWSKDGSSIPKELWPKHLAWTGPYVLFPEELELDSFLDVHLKLSSLIESMDRQGLLKEIELEKHQNKAIKEFSTGMRQRLSLALAIHSQRQVLLLDEPTSNLDARWQQWLWDALKKVAANRILVVAGNQRDEIEFGEVRISLTV